MEQKICIKFQFNSQLSFVIGQKEHLKALAPVVLLQMRASIGHNPVIFMPSHRSYADFLLMSYVCFHYNIMLPVIAAGMGR